MFADVDGGRLYYESAGAGEPVVLIHGFGFDARLWDDQWAFLSHEHRVIRYDLRGFGRSSLPGPGQPFSHFDDLAALLGYLDVPLAHLVGQSLGGGVAIDTALAHPALVRRLALVDSTLGGYTWTPDGGLALEAWPVGRRDGIEAARAVWLGSPMFAPALADHDAAPRLVRMIDDYSGWHWVNDAPLRALEPPAIDRLAEIAVPVLALVGERDLPDFHAIADRIAAGVPGARKTVLEGVGHVANMEDPDSVNQALVGFLG